jgi:outer membrane immunogenic protein
MKRTVVVAVAAFAAGAGTSLAADVVTLPPTYQPPPHHVAGATWTECYVGGNIGGGWSHKSYIWEEHFPLDDPTLDLIDGGSHTGNGFVAGVQAGCDWQHSGNWVVGIQGMFDWSTIEGSHEFPGFEDFTESVKIPWVASATLRLGHLIQPQTLLYIKGGAAFAHDEVSSIDETDPMNYSFGSATRVGWTVGGGLEHKFTSNWSAFVEYNYMDFGSGWVTMTCPDCQPQPGEQFRYDIDQSVHLFQVGINYRFGGHAGAGPVSVGY